MAKSKEATGKSLKGKQAIGKSLKGKEVIGKSSSGKRKSVSKTDGSGNARSGEKKRFRGLKFVDDVAMDADYDEEEELDSDEESDDNDFVDDLAEETGGTNKTAKMNVLPFLVKEEGQDLENFIKERYSHVVYADDSQDVKGFDDRMATMHSMKDPIIWKVRCTAGREQQLAVCLMQKFIELQNLNTRLQIISAFAIDHLKGCIFVEAEKESHVIEACKGYCYVYTSRISLVPHSEVPHLLSVEHKPCGLSEGMWVRIKNGNYKGDLGQVVAVEENRKRAMIKLIPRIDLQALAQKFGGGMSLKQTPVPAPRLIRPVELEDFRPHIERKRDRLTGEVFDELDGMMLKEGFLYKKVSLGSLSYLDIQPSADEEERFKLKTGIHDDLDWLSELYEGHGKVHSAHLAEKKNRVSGTRNECSYLLNDFVLFGQKDFGLIVGVDGKAFKIIKGAVEATEVVTVTLQDIKKKMCDKMFTAPDSNRTTVTIGDTLKVVGGPFEGREGILRHLYKGTVFIQDNSNLENNGYFCTKSELCEKINVKGTCKGMEVQQSSAFHNAGSLNYQPESSGNRGHCRSFRSNYQGEGDRFSIGQTLRIRVGPLKGHLCRVVALHRYDLTVKLLSQAKVIKVSHDHISELKNLSENSFGQVTNGGFKDDSDKGFGSPKETSGWKSELPSFGRDLCNLSSSSLFASDFSKTLDTILSSDVLKTGDITDGWPKVVEKATVGSIADPWERKSNQIGESDEATGGWEKPRPCSGADLWGSKSNQTDEPHKATGGWGNADVGSRAAAGLSADCWLSKSNQAGEYDKATDGWGKKTAVGSNDDHWASKSNDAGDFDKTTDDLGKKTAVGTIDDHWARKSSGAGDSDKATDDWKHAAVGSSADLWASKLNQSGESDKAIDGWEKAAYGCSADSREVRSNQAVESNNPTDRWAKAALGSSADPWNSKSNRSGVRDEPFDGSENAPRGSNQAVESDQATDGWEKAAGDSRANPVEVKSNQTSISKDSAGGWEKAGLGSMADPWETKWNPAGESAKATDGPKNSALGPSDNPWERQSSQDRESNEAADGWQRAAKQPSCDPMEETEKQADLSVRSPGWDDPWGKSADQVSYSSKSIDGADNPLTRDKPDSWNKAVNNNDGKKSWHDSSQENVWTKSTTGYCAGGWKGAGQCGDWGDAAKDVVRQEQSQNDTNKWNRSNSFGGQQGLGWNKASEGAQGSGFSRRGTEDDRDGWGGQSGGWSKMRAFEGGRGSGGRRGRGERGGRGVEQGQGERGRGGWGGRGGARGGRGDYSGRGRDFSNQGRFSGQDHSGRNQNQESNFSGVDGNSGGGWNDYKGDGGQARSWNKGTYFNGGRSELSEYGGSKELDGSSWGKACCEGQPSSNWNKKAFDEDDGSNRLEKWSSEKSNGCGTSTGWKRGQDSFERDPNSSWQKTNYFGGEDLVDQGGRGDNEWRGGRRGGGRGGDRGGGRGGRGFGRGRGRGFSGEHSSSGWNKGDRERFGGNGSSGWNKSDKEGFGGNGSSGWNKGDRGGFGGSGSGWKKGNEGGFGGKGSSGWNNGDGGGFGGKGSSGWNNGDGGGFGGKGSSGWNNGDGGGFGGNGSSGWNNGGGGSGGNGSSGWNNSDGDSGGNGSGWSKGDRGGFGGNGTSGWNGGDGGGFGGNGSGCKRGDEGGFGGQGSSGLNKGDRGGFGGNRSSGWNNGNGGLGGNGSSGWKNGDDGGSGGKGSSGWNKGDGVVCGGATPAWNNGEGGNEGGVKEGQNDPWEKLAGSWGKTSEPSEKGGW